MVPVVLLAALLSAVITSCGPHQSGVQSGGDLWTLGKSDFSGLGVSFVAPTDLEPRSGSGVSMNWIAATGDEKLVVSFEVTLVTSNLAQWVADSITLDDNTVVTKQAEATSVLGRSGASLWRPYSVQKAGGKTLLVVVAVVPRDSVDKTGFGGVRIVGSSTAGSLESLKQRVLDLAASVKFSSIQPQTQVRNYLAVGEWSFTGPVNTSGASSDIGKQMVWLCTGKMAYKQVGFSSNTVLDAADSKLLTGTWEAYDGVGQPVLYIKIDGDSVTKLFPISLQTDSRAFTWGSKQFLGTDRGCELGLPQYLAN